MPVPIGYKLRRERVQQTLYIAVYLPALIYLPRQ
jgi:hypothetical protein